MKRLLRCTVILAAGIALASPISVAQYPWTKDIQNPVLAGGSTGAWDQDVCIPWVIFNPDSGGPGGRFEMWYSGSFPHGGIGFAISSDGRNWTKDANPVLTYSPGSWDSILIASSCVLRENGQYKMWYTGVYGPAPGGIGIGATEIGYATSPDGRHWTKYADNPVLKAGTRAWDKGSVAYCSVVKCIGGYQMFYTASSATGQAVIGRAVSTDGIAWQTDTIPVLNVSPPGAWDRQLYCPTVFVQEGIYFMCYTAEATPGGGHSNIGIATSNDSGRTWTKSVNNPVVPRGNVNSWDNDWIELGSVLLKGGTFHMWYDGGGFLSKVGHATAPLRSLRLVPSQYATIQTAIDAAHNGDTVLVSEGTYFENIRYRGKAIVVGSQFVVDGDTSHISKTIIDGGKSAQPDSGSVVSFVNGEDTTSVLCGLTIQGGSGTRWYYSGTILAWVRSGGGVFCNAAGAKLLHNVITRNRVIAPMVYGGGVEILGTHATLSNAVIEGNRIVDNLVAGSSTYYWAYSGGVDISGANVRIVNNVFERDSVMWGQGASGGGLSFTFFDQNSPLPSGQIIGNTFRANIARTWYQGALGAGCFVGWTMNVTIRDNLFEENDASSTGGWTIGGGLFVGDQDITGYGRKMIVNNRFRNNTVSCSKENHGAGLSLWKTLATVSGNEFSKNSVEGTGVGDIGPGGGAGLSAYASSFRIENNIFTGNTSVVDGGGMLLTSVPQSGSEQLVINNTLVDNHAAFRGGGIRQYSAANTILLNTILWNDTAGVEGPEIFATGAFMGVGYCDVAGSYQGTNMLNLDPRFIPGDTLFDLQGRDPDHHELTVSPCIGTGIDSIQVGEFGCLAPRCDIDGHPRPMPVGPQPVDIGAQEEQITVDVREAVSAQPTSYGLEQNYPNPFNPTTVISYQLPVASWVRLVVFDLLGREVKTLVNEKKEPGAYQVKFDGSGLASGVYFYRLQAGEFSQTKRLMLLK
jgi:predicted GH43/DUF377 family glycosyl hydrolase